MAEIKKKSKEELEKEQKAAAEQLSQMMKTSKPKNLGQGVGRGVSNILAGAVGGVGIAVVAPTVGLAAGTRGGGIIGGAIGLTAGAVVGILGAAGLIVGGAVSGVTQIVRGVIAQPEAMLAPRQGKWWNDSTSEWVYTDLSKTSVPDNDNDILGSIESDLDGKMGSSKSLTHSGEVVDTFYYEALEVDTTADEHKIKRQYYLLARKYHPDKNPGDKEATDKFKTVAEAYQVLSDPQLRAKYDKEGKDALSGCKTSTNDGKTPDPSLLLAFLFGSDQFHDYIGRLATSTSAMLGDNQDLSLIEARTLQQRRVTRLAIKIVARVAPWVNGDLERTESKWKTDAEVLCKASYGWELLQLIGMAYELSAVQFLGSNDSGLGMPSIAKWADGKKAKHRLNKAGTKNQWEIMMATVDGMKVQAQFQEKLKEAKTEDETMALKREMADATTAIMLRIIWTTTTVDIISSIHESCQMVFFDHSVDKETRKLRALAVKKLGEIFQAVQEPQYPDGGMKNAKALFEEAAMAATLETIRRKDEATYEAGGYNH